MLVPDFGSGVGLLPGGRAVMPGKPGRAPAPTAPGWSSSHVDGMVRAGHAGAGRAHSRCQQPMNASFHGQSGLIFRNRCRAWTARRAGMCQIRRSVSGSKSRRSASSQQSRRRVQAARSAAMFAATTQPQLTCQVFEAGSAGPWHGGADAAGLDDGVLAVHGVDVLRVVAARHPAYPGVRDVRAGDGVFPAGLLLVAGQVPQVAARRLHRRAIRSSMAGAPARSSVRLTVGPLGAAPSATATAGETSTISRSYTGDFPAFRSAPPSQAVSPAWSAAFRSRTARSARPGRSHRR